MKQKHNHNLQNFQILASWRTKINFLKVEIDKLEKLDNLVIFSISRFLLLSQLVEFEIKQLIPSLSFFMELRYGENIRYLYPYEYDEKKYTLGMMIVELKKFSRVRGVKGLVVKLNRLLMRRNKFAHGLYSMNLKVNDLTPMSKKGSSLCDEIINHIIRIENYTAEWVDIFFSRLKKKKI